MGRGITDQTIGEKLLTWHQEGKHQIIVDFVEKLSPQDRTYEVKGRLACALNNLERYAQALQVLRAMASSGAEDPIYFFRKGYACFYLKRYREAERAFRESARLDPEDVDCWWFLATIYRNHLNSEKEYRWAAAHLRELDPEEFTRSFGDPRAYVWGDNGEEAHEEVNFARLWHGLGEPTLEKFRDAGLDWMALSENEREIAALTLLEAEVKKSGFLKFYENWGMDGYRNARRGLAKIASKKCFPEIENMFARLWRAVEICYSIVAPHKNDARIHAPEDIGALLNKAEKDELRGREATFCRNAEALGCKAWLCYQGERVFQADRPFDPNFKAVTEMADDAYYPAFLVGKIRALLDDLIGWLEQGSRTYQEIEEKIGDVCRAAGELEADFQENGSELDHLAWESIGGSVASILDWFGIDLSSAAILGSQK